MGRFIRTLIGLALLAASFAAMGNFYATGMLAPCDAAAVLRAGIGRPPPGGTGLGVHFECQREVIVHLYGQLTGAARAQ